MSSQEVFLFQVGAERREVRMDLPSSWMANFAHAPRSFSYSGALPRDWKIKYFGQFLTHDADREPLQSLLSQLRAAGAPAQGDGLVEWVTAFVQTAIEYDWHTAYHIADGKIHYPTETLIRRKGVCADKTILLAALLRQLGYGVAILSWDRAQHMALGILVPGGQGNFGSEYAMVESTGPAAIGTVPDTYAGGIRLQGAPEITVMGAGKKYEGVAALRAKEKAQAAEYGPEYLRMPPTQQAIFREMQPLKAELDRLIEQRKSCQGKLQPAQYEACQKLATLHNQKIEEYNRLVHKFNAANPK